MRPPVAHPVTAVVVENPRVRPPRAFAPERAADAAGTVESFAEPEADPEGLPAPRVGAISFIAKVVLTAGNVILALGVGIVADILIRALFERSPWLGWLGVAVVAIFVAALLALLVREYLSLRRLRLLDRLRARAAAVLVSDSAGEGRRVVGELVTIYHSRPDLARVRDQLGSDARDLFDGADMVRLAERTIMTPLDARAKSLVATSARRVALVTAVSPRALVDIAFVAWESIRLAGAIARLYGARPGALGALRLAGSVLSHLAITGGLALTDGAMEQLIGHGLAARISARLGEGLVNGLMTVRVGIAAIRVVRPLPFDTQRTPMVRDFIPELANVMQKRNDDAPPPR